MQATRAMLMTYPSTTGDRVQLLKTLREQLENSVEQASTELLQMIGSRDGAGPYVQVLPQVGRLNRWLRNHYNRWDCGAALEGAIEIAVPMTVAEFNRFLIKGLMQQASMGRPLTSLEYLFYWAQ